MGRDLLAWCDIPSCGAAGGMLLMWDPSVVSKEEELIGSFFIYVRFKDVASGCQWLFTGVYGPSSLYKRHVFWKELFDVRGFWPGPWVI